MNSVRQNLIANFAGQGWAALMGFVFVPFYLRFIGAEGYGLVGFFVLISSTAALLDGGLGVTATRQTAAFLQSDRTHKTRTVTLLRTIEGLFWVVSVFAGVTVALAARLIATHWLKVEPARIPEVTSALRLMGATLVVQFPNAFYSGCLVGLQQQVKLNAINAIYATLRGIGAVLVLWLVAPNIQVFFVWQCVLSLITVTTLRFAFWNAIGEQRGATRFDLEALHSVGRFTAGVGGINILSFLLTQVDKIVLSKILSLQAFGYYTLAWTLGTFAYRFTGPIFNAYYPKLTQLVAEDAGNFADLQQPSELVDVYLKASQVMAIVIVPFSVWLAFFGRELLWLWTRDHTAAYTASGALAVIALGTMLNGFMHIPYGVQLAAGWTGLAFWQNVIGVLLFAPLTYYFAIRYGLTGAAVPWLLLNTGYVVISAPLMYKVMLRSAKWKWYRWSVIYPFLQASCLIGLFYFLSIQFNGPASVTVLLFCALFISVSAGTLSSGLMKIHR